MILHMIPYNNLHRFACRGMLSVREDILERTVIRYLGIPGNHQDLDMRFMSISNARQNFAELVGQAERTTITKNGEPVSVLLRADDYRALVVAQTLAKDPESLAHMVDAHRKVSAGDLSDTESLEVNAGSKKGAQRRRPARRRGRRATAS